MTYQCELKEQSAQPALSIRTHAAVQDLPQVLGKAYSAIMQYLGEVGEQPAGMPFAAYYNMDMQNLDIEAGFPVARKIAGKGEIQASEFPGGKLASTVHIGPYEQMAPAYKALTQWIKANGYEATGVAYEVYFSEPETPPQEIKTEIVFPLK
ncbi:MAG: GyrI-like domain-containing protein [Chloroflexi bacterium]|nr:GyrI-like domain-containing protein [Chloroflexota bacterium]